MMHGFPPVVNDKCKVLILGSFPSAESRRLREYYAHRQNGFWKIMFALFSQPYSSDYVQRKELLLMRGIALWDVVYSHDGAGSADKDIKGAVPNDFTSFFRKHPGISRIYFNGSTAETLFFRLVPRESVPDGVVFARLYSSSPANARYSFNEKLINWSLIKEDF